ncbi:cyclic pyranopterin monophosphate synthase [Ruminiclostridium hungatei]|uniref:Cyclic pyranopterin monophosphate synthase n=1 Tax=Ruminiclostridium hungatei TaxID=48256 RepID=A0A1V4SHV2_RUMHU|nr:radical SAM protein [Ruminiclostridium hungatei]OPX43384.1 cyclic pyranopterin monophosphate synthase [Ruminiclostridium hungatei]
MIVRRHSTGYNFLGDTGTGLTLRWADGVGENPVYAPWPELADISISNHCSKGCDFCYRDSKEDNSFMTIGQYEKVLAGLQHERWGTVFQVALGGGEPLEHPDFKKIIQATCDRGIVANFTTNGERLNEDIVGFLRGKIGALAISAARIDQIDTGILRLLAGNEIRTNLHFILDNRSIAQGIDMLRGKYNDILKHVNSVIFLTYKPKGRAQADKCLELDSNLRMFLNLVNKNKCSCSVGFDACFVPLLMKHTEVNVDCIDSCECGFFSVYIDENMNVKPCSFASDDSYSFNLNDCDFKVIWGKKYDKYRKEVLKNRCNSSDCANKSQCRGKCVYFEDLQFCYVN